MLRSLFSLGFWMDLFSRFQGMGPLAPFLLAAMESFLPPLPLVAIVTLNVAAHGAFAGFLYSWTGTCLGCTLVFLFVRFALRRFAARAAERHPAARRAREWVPTVSAPSLFVILMMPFTPSSLMNFAFGLSEYPPAKYLLTLYAAKLVMIGSLALFGQSAVRAAEDPRFVALSLLLAAGLYLVSRKVREKHGL